LGPGRDYQIADQRRASENRGKEINWPELVASAERVGMDVEREANEAATEKRRERRDSAKGDDKSN